MSDITVTPGFNRVSESGSVAFLFCRMPVRLGLEALQNLKCLDPEPTKSGDHLVVSRAAIMVDAGGQ